MSTRASIEAEGQANALLDRATARQALIDHVLHEPVWARTLRSMTVAIGVGGPLTAIWLLFFRESALDAGAVLVFVVVPILLLAVGQVRNDRRLDALIALGRDAGVFEDDPARR